MNEDGAKRTTVTIVLIAFIWVAVAVFLYSIGSECWVLLVLWGMLMANIPARKL